MALRLLALDTATEACSVAVLIDGAVEERFELVQQGHSARLLPLVQEVLAAAGLALAQLDAVAFGRGPGSFTALRIGAGVVQGLAFGAGLPVVPVSSLAALAQGQNAARVLAAFDARMAQVYYGAYARSPEGLVTGMGEEGVAAPEEIVLPAGDGWIGAGSGWDRYADRLGARLGPQLLEWRPGAYPHARDVALLAAAAFVRGEAVAAEHAVPVYVRDDVARKKPRA